jgi:4-hydroxybenzoyl-CoA thioesterase/acyl-CoA thioester hydrolase
MPTDVRFRTQRRVEFSDTDMAGIMHFARFFHYMEQVEHEFLRSRGLTVIMKWEGQELGFPRVSAQCDYQAPIRFEEVMDVDLTLESIGTKSLTYRFEFSKEKIKLAAGKLVTCCCTMDKKHQMISIAIPETLKARLLGKS